MRLEVLLIDPRVIVRKALHALLASESIDVVSEAASVDESLACACLSRADVVVVDPPGPPHSLDLVHEIVRACPSSKPLVLTEASQSACVVDALRAGVRGYVLKTQSVAELVHALREVGHGAMYLAPLLSGPVLEASMRRPVRSDPLTAREREVLQLVAEGKTTKQAAQCLGVSTKTADTHRTRAMRKLDVHDTAGLVRYAIREGLIEA